MNQFFPLFPAKIFTIHIISHLSNIYAIVVMILLCFCLIPFGLLKQNTFNWVDCKCKRFILTVLEIESPRSGRSSRYYLFAHTLLSPHMVEGAINTLGPFYNSINPNYESPTTITLPLPKAPPPNTMTLGLRTFTHKLGGRHIQTILFLSLVSLIKSYCLCDHC
jgi:hypothetical protein